MSLLDKVVKITSLIIKVPVDKLSVDSCLGNPTAWDSVAHTNLILELESVFDVGFEFDELDRITSIQTIVDSLNSKGVNV